MGKYCKMMLLLLLSLLLLQISLSTGATQGELDECQPYPSCTPDGPQIRFPFRLKEVQPERCGLPGFELSCKSNGTVLNLPSYPEGLFIRSICYTQDRLFIYAPDGCTKALLFNLNLSSSPFTYSPQFSLEYTPRCDTYVTYPSFYTRKNFTFVNCSEDAVTGYRKEISCSSSWDSVLLVPSDMGVQSWPSCTKLKSVEVVDLYDFGEYNIFGMDSGLMWFIPGCVGCEGVCRFKNKWSNQTECHIIKDQTPPWLSYETPPSLSHKGVLLKKVTIGISIGFLLLILVTAMAFKMVRSWKSSREKHRKVDEFLEDYKTRKPTRYNYSDIKRMTNQFKTKLGQGAYGSVYKGNLPNETPVAVKILKDSIGDGGGDFINEVGTIGRIHHVNVVRLLGFCADGINRALIYEFMPNESLDKLIFAVNPEKVVLTWEKLQRIAMGIARGIEYLHQGCDQQILHFDIKPNNILLDSNFNPKISDFGLAKLCSKEQSNVSITAARGTMGYIAPEVFSRNIGKVSYKSDVYSFGMLLLEMVGGRKNTDATVENPSRVYFPEWVYNHLDQLEQEGGVVNEMTEEGDGEIVKKLTVVGLWCIQWYPVNRPSMKSVVQMLEGGMESLTIPPNPFVSMPPRNVNATMAPENPISPVLTIISE